MTYRLMLYDKIVGRRIIRICLAKIKEVDALIHFACGERSERVIIYYVKTRQVIAAVIAFFPLQYIADSTEFL